MKGPATASATGTLYVVATPIGNLEDITLRALRVLREVALVAAEDTRRTGNLLRHYEIGTPLVSVHEHNERHRAGRIIERLKTGQSVALVSDAGTPGISDPGAALVQAVRTAGLPVEAIPGPSAVTTALSAAGLCFERFAFAGFAPIRSKDREKWFAWVNSVQDVPVVCFEAPHRIKRTLAECHKYFGKRPIICARELTKAFEEWTFGTAEELLASAGGDRGEFVLIMCPVPETQGDREAPADTTIGELFGQLTEKTLGSRRAAIREVGQRLHVSSREVFDALERYKKSGK